MHLKMPLMTRIEKSLAISFDKFVIIDNNIA